MDRKGHIFFIRINKIYTKNIPHEKYTEISSEGCYTYPMDNTGCPLISYASDDHEDYDNIEFFFKQGSRICFF